MQDLDNHEEKCDASNFFGECCIPNYRENMDKMRQYVRSLKFDSATFPQQNNEEPSTETQITVDQALSLPAVIPSNTETPEEPEI